MAKQLKKIFIPTTDEVVQNFKIQSWHVSQSVDALTGNDAYDIAISGSLEVEGPVNFTDLETTTGQTGVLVLDGTSVKKQITTLGTSGSSGTSGTSGSGTSGSSGTSGTSGTAGSSGTSGSSGNSGSSGTSGSSGISGSSGTSGESGSSGTSGTSGISIAGSSGTSGTSGTALTGTQYQMIYFSATDTPTATSNLTWNDSTNVLNIVGQTKTFNNFTDPTLILETSVLTVGDGSLLGYLAGYNDDQSNTNYSPSIKFEGDGTWDGTFPASYPTRIDFLTTKEGASVASTRLRIKNDGQIILPNYIGTNFIETPTYNLAVTGTGKVVRESRNYAGNNYSIVNPDRVDYRSTTVNLLRPDGDTGTDVYSFELASNIATEVPLDGEVLIQSLTKSSNGRMKIAINDNSASFASSGSNSIVPISGSQLKIGEGPTNYALYNIKNVTHYSDALVPYVDLIVNYDSEVGSSVFTNSGNITGHFKLSGDAHYLLSNYYTRLTLGNLSEDQDFFAFGVDEDFRNTLNSGDELIVDAKWFSDTSFGTSGNTVDLLAEFTYNHGVPFKRLKLINQDGGANLAQISNTQGNWGRPIQIKFMYWEREEDEEWGLLPTAIQDYRDAAIVPV